MKRLNSRDNAVLHTIGDDMRPVYQTMLDMNCGLQVVCVEIMPWKEYESEEAIIWCVDEESYENQRGILFVKGNEINDIVEILKRNISNMENAVTIIDSTNTKFLPTLSRNRVLNLYKELINICDDLEIKCPSLVFTNSIYFDDKRAMHIKVFDEEDNSKGDWVWVRGQRYYYMLQSLAHELRHMYQQKNDENYFENYITPEEDMHANRYSEVEIDANAYGVLYVERITGKNGLKYAFDNVEEYNHPYWTELKILIKNQMDKIKKQKEPFGAKQSITA